MSNLRPLHALGGIFLTTIELFGFLGIPVSINGIYYMIIFLVNINEHTLCQYRCICLQLLSNLPSAS